MNHFSQNMQHEARWFWICSWDNRQNLTAYRFTVCNKLMYISFILHTVYSIRQIQNYSNTSSYLIRSLNRMLDFHLKSSEDKVPCIADESLCKRREFKFIRVKASLWKLLLSFYRHKFLNFSLVQVSHPVFPSHFWELACVLSREVERYGSTRL